MKHSWLSLFSCWQQSKPWRTRREGSAIGHAAGSSPPAPHELQTILLAPDPCGTDPCIDPIFGPITTAFHLSSTTVGADNTQIWKVDFFNGHVSFGVKTFPLYVRAVRGGP